ncbi:TPA: hypothetical protein N0F65_008319 [Lagenidium giganteum]|uniref:Mitogen-activated protein kinase n=1 Tax=Lagenidium giganteum TaxID=4803 RepID=A0AAV2YPY6_9STRA|nr:TPA: hypothetical protein N0F65_008319 [Lagenidium giganteum]
MSTSAPAEAAPKLDSAWVTPAKKRKGRLRTQSEGAAWTRASLRMHAADGGGAGDADGSVSPQHQRQRNSDSAMPEVAEELEGMDLADRRSFLQAADTPQKKTPQTQQQEHVLDDEDVDWDDDEDTNLVRLAQRCSYKQRTQSTGALSAGRNSTWLEQGKISARASEMLEDAKLSLHGKEKNLYMASARRLSEAQDPMLNSLGEKIAQQDAVSRSNSREPDAEAAAQADTADADALATSDALMLVDLVPATPMDDPGRVYNGEKLLPEASPPRELSDLGHYVRPESATLYHEAVRWEGVLSKRSEWLRRLEKHYYVLEGKFLRRFASKEAYLASRDEPLLREHERPRRNSTATNAVSHLYVLAGVKDSATRTNGFTFITEDKKMLQLQSPTPVEKVIWMRLGLEAIVALPGLPVAPLDMEEFYAMLVVLYTAHRGNWRTEGDMAVTLPPPSEQVFTRFFRLLDKDIIFCSNYPPSVPFHGSYRGHAGLVRFMHEFSKNTLWTNFKIAGLSVEGALAVASGKEELENKRDGRKFIQNWVHKFTFYSNGRLARFEINGDVVAASAVFKVPGAATTLKLPQEFNEVDAEHGKKGTILVRVMQGNGLKMGTSLKKTVKEASVALTIVHREKPMPKPETSTSSSTGLAALSMPALTRKISSGITMLTSSTSSAAASSNHADAEVAIPSNATGPPSDASTAPANPVWNKVISVPFANVIGTCTLVMEVTDFAKGTSADAKIGVASVNIAKYIMSAEVDRPREEEEAALAADSRWYTISNAKGEYCGKVQLGITCRRGNPDPEPMVGQPRLKKSQSVYIDRTQPPSSHMLQWEQSINPLADPASTRSVNDRASASAKSDDFGNDHRRHGWANVKLSPENLVRTRSDGAVSQGDAAAAEPERVLSSSTDAVVCKENENMHTFMVCGAPFTIPRHYQLIKVCGRGAYGIVIAATNMRTGGNVAIKKVIDCIWHPHQLKQILREVRLIRHMHHENVLSLMDLIPPPSFDDFRDVYMTVDLMEMDLHRIIYSKEVLLDDHIRYFLYQMLSGLNHMHKAGVLHRDLKPSNLLINSDCQLKICDLGLARSKDLEDAGMTEYVVTRWYRAPELLLGSAYGEGVDLWAAGCIFAEMLGRKPLFPGETYVHQLQLIMNVLGVPEEHSFKENPQANKLKGRQLLSRTQAASGIDLSTLFSNANPEALDLLWKMLVFDVEKRLTVQEALRHPYLAAYYDEELENRPVEQFESFDLDGLDENDLKELMFKEICHFHPEEMEKRAKVQADNPNAVDKLPPGWVKRESRSVPGKFYYSNPKRGVSTWIKEEMD